MKPAEMKILEPVSEIPVAKSHARSKYRNATDAALSLSKGKFLPVECSSQTEASGLRSACKALGLTACQRNCTVFIEGKA